MTEISAVPAYNPILLPIEPKKIKRRRHRHDLQLGQ